MKRFAPLRRFFPVIALTAATALLAAAPVLAQFSNPKPAGDKSPLRPPPGARVALYVFEDLECPDCSRAAPLLKEASEKYKIPLMRHDFPLPFHAWSNDAAINARWFDTKSKKLGDDYRDAVFANQRDITAGNLRTFTEKFAASHKLTLPFAVDPQGRLAALVKADYALGQRIGIEHTPTIWVVTNKTNGVPFVEVVDRSKLYELIDTALAETKPAAPARSGVARNAGAAKK